MKENIYYQYDSSQLPEISLADTAVIEPPYIHKRRMPLEYIIYLVRQGEMFLSEDGVRYHLTPGDFLVLDPDKSTTRYFSRFRRFRSLVSVSKLLL